MCIPGPLRAAPVILGLACSALIAGCADRSFVGETDADLAAARGDWAEATILAERVYDEHPTVAAKFKLATAYQKIGQVDRAVALYEDVIFDGGSTPSRGVRSWGDRHAHSPL